MFSVTRNYPGLHPASVFKPPLFDTWIAEDADFQRDILNSGYRNLGIGIASDGYNYYIVTQWQ